MLSNNAKVMDAVREGRNNVPKKELQRLTGLSWGTMCKVTDTLLEKGYLFKLDHENFQVIEEP